MACRGERLAIRRKRDGADRPGVALALETLRLLRGVVPEVAVALRASRGETAAVRREADRPDGAEIGILPDLLPGMRRAEQTNAAVPATRQDKLAVRREGERAYPVRMGHLL